MSLTHAELMDIKGACRPRNLIGRGCVSLRSIDDEKSQPSLLLFAWGPFTELRRLSQGAYTQLSPLAARRKFTTRNSTSESRIKTTPVHSFRFGSYGVVKIARDLR